MLYDRHTMPAFAWAFAALLCLLVQSAPVRAADRVYTIDQVLGSERVGASVFSKDGTRLFFERWGPHDDMVEFGRHAMRGQYRSKIYVYDVGSGREPRRLFRQRDDDGYTMGSLSPDGQTLFFKHAGMDGWRVGSVDLARGRARTHPPGLQDVFRQQPVWVSDHQLVFASPGPGRHSLAFELHADRQQALARQWQVKRRGQVATASVMATGALRGDHGGQRAGSLVLIDTRAGSSTTLAHGRFVSWAAAPDGALLAALIAEPAVLDPQIPVSNRANAALHRRLVLLELPSGKTHADAGHRLDVLSRSLLWSPDGEQLLFVARQAGQAWSDATLWALRASDGHVRQVAPGDVRVNLGGDLSFEPEAFWLGDGIVFQAARDGQGSEGSGGDRPDWFVTTDGGEPRPLGRIVGQDAFTIVGALDGRLLLIIAENELYTVTLAGRVTKLAFAFDCEITPRTAHTASARRLWTLPKNAAGDVVVTVDCAGPAGEDAGAGHRLLYVNIDKGTVRSSGRFEESAAVQASSAASGLVFVRTDAGTSGRFAVLDSASRQSEVVHLNPDLAALAAVGIEKIEHRATDGSDRTSWLLLPPGYAAGDGPLPTVVNPYLGSHRTSPRPRPRDGFANSPYDMRLLAAQGFAVLLPDLRQDYAVVPRTPLTGLARETDMAVDAAIRDGYVDPDRLALFGVSYGAYTVTGIIGQTDRYKATVATSGIYNLISVYGNLSLRERYIAHLDGPNLFQVKHAETMQLGMGGPPWRDPERYIENSPLMHVERITTPVMLIHGDLDLLPLSQAEELYIALHRLNRDAVFVRYWGEGHSINSPANLRDMWRRKIDWFKGYIGPPFDTGLQGS